MEARGKGKGEEDNLNNLNLKGGTMNSSFLTPPMHPDVPLPPHDGRMPSFGPFFVAIEEECVPIKQIVINFKTCNHLDPCCVFPSLHC